MNNKVVWILLAAAIVAAAAAGTGWYHAGGRLRELRASELEPLAALLKDDQELLGPLRTQPGAEKGHGILGYYLAAIRADGVAKHADTKQVLDRIAENNSAIVALIDVYATHAKTAAFGEAAGRFRRYAIAWRDRWNSVMELFMAGGNYPVAEVTFPTEFSGAVQAELEANSHIL